MDVVLWVTIAVIVVISIITAYIFRSTSGKVDCLIYIIRFVKDCLQFLITKYYLLITLGKTSDARPAEGTDGENVANRQAGQQGVRRRAGLRAQLQASRRARLARISEDEQDGMLTRTSSYKFA